jgi:hypothetical protein
MNIAIERLLREESGAFFCSVMDKWWGGVEWAFSAYAGGTSDHPYGLVSLLLLRLVHCLKIAE